MLSISLQQHIVPEAEYVFLIIQEKHLSTWLHTVLVS
jgi:hypothetical protein